MKREEKTIAKNRRAFHDYEVVETFEAGVELSGTEVRSLRENNCQLTDCFALVRNGEVWMHNVHITPFSHGNINNPDPIASESSCSIKSRSATLRRRRAKRAWRSFP